jgi:hypothetical protein
LRLLTVDTVESNAGIVQFDRILVGQTEGRKPFWKPYCRWEDNIKCLLKKQFVQMYIVDSGGSG